MSDISPIQRIVKRDGTIVAHDGERITTAIFRAMASLGRPDRERAAEMTTKVGAALIHTYGAESTPSVEDIQDVVESVLMENHETDTARSYIIYRHERAMLRAARRYTFESDDRVPYKKIYEVLRWNIDHGCDTVDGLNAIIAAGDLPELVQAVDRRYDEETRAGAGPILRRLDDIRVVIIAGPSSSGKTTTTIKISEELARAGVKLRAINIDNYFFDLEKHPVDEFGDYDYETPQALDLALIDHHLSELLAGREIRTPHYNFKTGKRSMDVHAMRLEENEIVLIDSLHGLYDEMTKSVPGAAKFRVYIETLGQLKMSGGAMMRWADNRLLRRMIRDRDHRNLQPMDTLTHWHYVRRGELEHIIPFIASADYLINSALPYELPFLKQRLFDTIAGARHTFEDDPRRLDAHIRANRVFDLLDPLTAAADNACIPDDSLLREFIGGSRYTY